MRGDPVPQLVVGVIGGMVDPGVEAGPGSAHAATWVTAPDAFECSGTVASRVRGDKKVEYHPRPSRGSRRGYSTEKQLWAGEVPLKPLVRLDKWGEIAAPGQHVSI